MWTTMSCSLPQDNLRAKHSPGRPRPVLALRRLITQWALQGSEVLKQNISYVIRPSSVVISLFFLISMMETAILPQNQLLPYRNQFWSPPCRLLT
jgi:hypothetical protein